MRRPPEDATTHRLLGAALQRALEDAGVDHADVDGLGVASFSLTPDRAIDLAWHLGLRLDWMMEDVLGMNAVLHAARAVQAGDASVIAIVAGDRLTGGDYGAMVSNYNVATRDHLTPIPLGGPNPLFALMTLDHMERHGLSREDYGRVVVAQRAWAGTNPNAAYRDPLTMEEYLAAPVVADPLTRLDCPPVVAGADAIVLMSAERAARRPVRIRAAQAVFNHDGQQGDGLVTGVGLVAPALWEESGFGVEEADVIGVYDDYPVMVLAQLEELGLAPGGDVAALTRRLGVPGGDGLAVNTSGGLLCAGQPGGASSTHGLVEAVRQLRNERGDGQVPGARRAVVSAYGMVLYRYGACSIAMTLEAEEAH
jgi:acetyl-CoA acetyltransferase